MRRHVNAAVRARRRRDRAARRARAAALSRRAAVRRRGRVRRRRPLLGQRLPHLPGRLGRSAAGPAPPVPRGVRPVRAARLGRSCACHRVGGGSRKRSRAARRPRRRPSHGARRRRARRGALGRPAHRGLRGERRAAVRAPGRLALLLVFAIWWSRRRDTLLLAAGALAAFSVLVKQSGYDGGGAIVHLARARCVARLASPAAGAARDRPRGDRRRGPRPARVPHGAATGFDRWWFAVAKYRLSVESVATGSLSHRADLLW